VKEREKEKSSEVFFRLRTY